MTWRRRVATLVGAVLVALSVVGTLTAVVVRFNSVQERSPRFMAVAGMTTSVAIVCALLGVIGAALIVSVARPWRWSAVIALVPLLIALQFAAPTLGGLLRPEHARSGTELSVLVQNLWYGNADPDRTARMTLDRHAQVVVLLELTPAHAEAFEAAGSHEQYRYRWEVERPFGKGIAVLSTVPFDPPEDLDLSGPSSLLRLHVEDHEVALFAVHTNSPSSIYDLPRWQLDMEQLSRAVANSGPATIVAGDFNATSGHIRFRELLEAGGLRDAQDVAGGGFVDTWPIMRWAPPVLRLDHILVGAGIGVERFESLPRVGSDHRGVEAWLRVGRD